MQWTAHRGVSTCRAGAWLLPDDGDEAPLGRSCARDKHVQQRTSSSPRQARSTMEQQGSAVALTSVCAASQCGNSTYAHTRPAQVADKLMAGRARHQV